MKQVLVFITVALTGTLAIPPQVRHGAPTQGAFAGAQNVARAPAVPLTHPLPPSPSTRDGRYQQGSFSSGSSNSNNNYGGSSSSSGSSNYSPNQQQQQGSRYESTNRVSSYAPVATTAAPARYGQAAQPVTRTGPEITILRSSFDDNADGTYSYAYENSDGTKTEQRGYVKNAGTDNEIFVQEGSYQYYGPDGVLYQVSYISDENGYQPTGAHLPAIPAPTRSEQQKPAYGSSSGSNYQQQKQNSYQEPQQNNYQQKQNSYQEPQQNNYNNQRNRF